MSVFNTVDPSTLIGSEIDSLTYEQCLALAGKWIALELYSPQTTPVRRIEAVAESPAGCINALRSRSLDPANFEFESFIAPN